MDVRPPPNLNDPAEFAAYRQELRNVVRGVRYGGIGLALIGAGFSAYLTYRELFTIHAICQWCVASAVLMAALAVLTTRRFLYPPVSDRYSSLAETPVRSETTDAATLGLAPASTSADTERAAASS